MTGTIQVDKTRLFVTRLVALTAVIAITVYIYSIRDRAAEFEQYGFLGIFVISFMAYATVVLPAPGVAVVAAMGGVFSPFLVGLVAGLGAACGELVGYLAGYSGRGVAEKIKIYDQLVTFTRRFGAWGVLILSIIPNPFFDLAGLAAGTLKMSVFRFFLACWVGETAKMMLFAYGGATFLELLG